MADGIARTRNSTHAEPDVMLHEMFLIDAQGNRLGGILIDEKRGSVYVGTFLPSAMPESLSKLLRDYHALAEDQILGLLDDIEDKITALGLKVMSASDSSIQKIQDLQLSPTNRISFLIFDE